MKKIDNPVYVCEVCGTRYKTEEEAMKCEKKCFERHKLQEERSTKFNEIAKLVEEYNKAYPETKINIYKERRMLDGDSTIYEIMEALVKNKF